MAAGDKIVTWFENTWHQGNPRIMGAADHGTWLGTLVFDGARAFDNLTPDLDLHCQRVNDSAVALGLDPTVSLEDMVAKAHEGLQQFEPADAIYIRPMYWSTAHLANNVVIADPESTAFALCLERVPLPPADASQRLTTTQFVRPLLSMATVNAKAACLYPNNARMIREAREKGFDNALVGDAMGNVAETATANIFMVRDGVVFTPIPNGCFLNGITRQRTIELLRADGVEVVEGVLSFDDFRRADEVFMSGNFAKINRVVQFDETHYQPGAMTARARSLYFDWAASQRD